MEILEPTHIPEQDYIRHLEDISDKYNELIFAVGNKYENETRHETALRYIRSAEKYSSYPCSTKSVTQNIHSEQLLQSLPERP